VLPDASQWRPVVVMLHRHKASPCRHGPRSTVNCLACAGDTDATAVDGIEDKVQFVVEHGIWPDRNAAEAFVASNLLSRFTLADYQQRAEALRMFDHPLAGAPVNFWYRTLQSYIVPRLAFVAEHACVPSSLHSKLTVPKM
jgi:transposase